MMKIIPKISFLLIITVNLLQGQVSVRLPELIVNRGEMISVPLLVSGFNNIGALSLAVQYNTSALRYTGISGANENFLVNSYSGTIYIAFAELLPFNSDSDTLLFLNFEHIQGNSLLTITGESETADINAIILPVTYTSGEIIDSQYQTSILGDRVWIDANKNGLQDPGEKGLQWVTVELFSCNNSWMGYKLTDSSGKFSFNELYEGDYFLQFSLVDDNSKYHFTSRNAGQDTLIDSDAEPLSDTVARTPCVHIIGGISAFNYDAGVYLQANNIPTDYYLAQNFPNPFNPSTMISFMLPKREFVTLTVYNLLGEKVALLLNEEKDPGNHFVEFDASGLGSGVYFYTLSTPSKILTGKMVLER